MLRIIFILIVSAVTVIGQEITNWQNFSNMENVSDIAFDENQIWAATTGGVFSYSLNDSSYKLLTKSDGLSSQTITAIAVDKNKNILIGSIDGYINVYYPETGQIKTILEIFKTNNSQKGINDIIISGDTAFVSTDFGLSLININNLSFFDSILKFGTFPSKTPVKSVYLGKTIYVVTNAGIAKKKKNAENLTAPETWEKLNIESQIPANGINKLIEYKNNLYAATNKGLVKFDDNLSSSIVLYNNFNILNFTIDNGYLYSILYKAFYKKEKLIKEISTLHKYNGIEDEVVVDTLLFKFNRIEIIDNNITIATNKGIFQYTENKTKIIKPNGPGTNAAISLTVDNKGHLWSATGKDGIGIGVMEYDKNNWITHNTSNVPEFKFNDFHKVSSSNSSVFFQSWGRGFVQYKDEKYTYYDAETTDMVGIPVDVNFIVIQGVEEDSKENIWVLNYWAANKKPLSVSGFK